MTVKFNLSEICDAMASALESTTGIRATGYPPDQPVPSCHFVQILSLEPSTFTSIHVEIVARVTTMVGRQTDRTGHQMLYRLMSHGMPRETFGDAEFWLDAGEDETPGGSVRDALWPSGSGDYLGVAGLGFVSLTTQAPGAISIGDAEFFAVEHTLTMIVRRT